jgi:hypothetical protein
MKHALGSGTRAGSGRLARTLVITVSLILAVLSAEACEDRDDARTDTPPNPAVLGALAGGFGSKPSLPADVTVSWWSQVSARMAHWDDRVREHGNGFAVKNRRLGLNAAWDTQGRLRVEMEANVLGPTKGSLALSFAGLEEAGAAVGDRAGLGACQAVDRTGPDGKCLQRLELRHDAVLEWWESREEGLEHGFVVEAGANGGLGP